MYYRRNSAGSRLQPANLGKADFAGATLLHVTGIPALSTTAAHTVERALDLAQKHSVPVSFDVNHRSRLWGPSDAAPINREIAKRASLVFAGTDEAELLVGHTGLSQRALAEAIAALGPAEVILNLGTDGAYALDGPDEQQMPAIPITAVDTVGAGDAFVAGYLAEWLNGLPLRARLMTAVRTGTAACLHPGNWEASPSRNGLAVRPGCRARRPVTQRGSDVTEEQTEQHPLSVWAKLTPGNVVAIQTPHTGEFTGTVECTTSDGLIIWIRDSLNDRSFSTCVTLDLCVD